MMQGALLCVTYDDLILLSPQDWSDVVKLDTLLQEAEKRFARASSPGIFRRLSNRVFGTPRSYRADRRNAIKTVVQSLRTETFPPMEAAALLQEWLRTAGSANDPSKLLAFSLKESGLTKTNSVLMRQRVRETLTYCASHPACRQALRTVYNQQVPFDTLCSAVLQLANNHPGTAVDVVFATCLDSLFYHYLQGVAYRQAIPSK